MTQASRFATCAVNLLRTGIVDCAKDRVPKLIIPRLILVYTCLLESFNSNASMYFGGLTIVRRSSSFIALALAIFRPLQQTFEQRQCRGVAAFETQHCRFEANEPLLDVQKLLLNGATLGAFD